jgi:hypothetical protein
MKTKYFWFYLLFLCCYTANAQDRDSVQYDMYGNVRAHGRVNKQGRNINEWFYYDGISGDTTNVPYSRRIYVDTVLVYSISGRFSYYDQSYYHNNKCIFRIDFIKNKKSQSVDYINGVDSSFNTNGDVANNGKTYKGQRIAEDYDNRILVGLSEFTDSFKTVVDTIKNEDGSWRYIQTSEVQLEHGYHYFLKAGKLDKIVEYVYGNPIVLSKKSQKKAEGRLRDFYKINKNAATGTAIKIDEENALHLKNLLEKYSSFGLIDAHKPPNRVLVKSNIQKNPNQVKVEDDGEVD